MAPLLLPPPPPPPPPRETFEAVLARHASRHNADGTGKTTLARHAYGPLYSRLFEPYRDAAREVLEIGVCSGASVLAMAEFFREARA
jgi:hypothetical protein